MLLLASCLGSRPRLVSQKRALPPEDRNQCRWPKMADRLPAPPAPPPSPLSPSPSLGIVLDTDSLLAGTAIAAGFLFVVILPVSYAIYCFYTCRRQRQPPVGTVMPVVPAPGVALPVDAPSPAPSQSSARNAVDSLEADRVAALRALPTFKWNSTHAASAACDECVLCMEAFRSGTVVRRLPCNHTFHRECIDRWLIVSMAHVTRACPLCKADPVSGVMARPKRQFASAPRHAPAPPSTRIGLSLTAAEEGHAGGGLLTPPRPMQPPPASPQLVQPPSYLSADPMVVSSPRLPSSAMRILRAAMVALSPASGGREAADRRGSRGASVIPDALSQRQMPPRRLLAVATLPAELVGDPAAGNDEEDEEEEDDHSSVAVELPTVVASSATLTDPAADPPPMLSQLALQVTPSSTLRHFPSAAQTMTPSRYDPRDEHEDVS